MARTAEYVVKKVLDMLVVGASEASIPAVDAQNVIDYMNDYMLSIDATGIKLGYTEVNSLGDTVTVPAGAIRGVIANVAMLVAPSYDVQISQGLALQAKAGQKAMLRLGSGIGPTQYPSTLPRGSGNYNDGGFRRSNFYNDLESSILSETNGPILVEDNTNV
jgi:hypothetical protein